MADVKKWLDDAKAKAAQEAGKAVVDGAVSAIEGRLDGWLGSMEEELARRQAEAVPPPVPGAAAADDEVAPEDAPAPKAAEPAGPTPEELARAELARLKGERKAAAPEVIDDERIVEHAIASPAPVVEQEEEEVPAIAEGVEVALPPLPPRPDPMDAAERALRAAAEARGVEHQPLPAPKPAGSRDPFAAANEALARAREARKAVGLPEPEPAPARPAPVPGAPRDPFAAANDALARAAEARASLGKSRVQADREDRAREELARLKAGKGVPSTPAAADDVDEDAPPPSGSGFKRRTL
ncbi:MAG: hypothetical protein H6738_00955 [Alphaproteobacteria bacterium]|nr:hypothetical protein [Alphaproteobacteria bacterium]MCB9695337.1 hypothetical protein [Alphaproteobacteria bacterium]